MTEPRHARIRRDLDALRQELAPGISHVIHATAPEREDGETLQEWRERVANDYQELRTRALAHHHDGEPA